LYANYCKQIKCKVHSFKISNISEPRKTKIKQNSTPALSTYSENQIQDVSMTTFTIFKDNQKIIQNCTITSRCAQVLFKYAH